MAISVCFDIEIEIIFVIIWGILFNYRWWWMSFNNDDEWALRLSLRRLGHPQGFRGWAPACWSLGLIVAPCWDANTVDVHQRAHYVNVTLVGRNRKYKLYGSNSIHGYIMYLPYVDISWHLEHWILLLIWTLTLYSSWSSSLSPCISLRSCGFSWELHMGIRLSSGLKFFLAQS